MNIVTSCTKMAVRHKLLGIVFSSFLLSVGGQCSTNDLNLRLASNRVVVESTGTLSVPISEARSTWTCLYPITGGSCVAASDKVWWNEVSDGSSYCISVTFNGKKTCMLAVDLHVEQPSEEPYVCHSIERELVKLTFRAGAPQPAQDSCFEALPHNRGCSGASPTSSTTHSDTSTSSASNHPEIPSTTPQSLFSGINPLIYTVTAVALLGTASIVAMISCCIRQRRAMLRRREFLFGREYLDFMSDRDFTQLTANQLAASLHEAPPTYQQSEDIERQLKDTQEDDDTPPPLPPRNQPQEPSNTPVPVEPIPSDHSEDEEEQENILQLLL